jgi:hypothetical protein
VTEPRQKTSEEIRNEFFALVHRYIDYYDKEPHFKTTREKLEGFAFSLMNVFDGTSSGIGCAFLLVPTCSASDPEFLRDEGENWYPVNEKVTEIMEGEISGGDMLHEKFSSYGKGGPDAP